MPGWERPAARTQRAAVSVILLAMPLTGWLLSSAGGFSVVLYGVIPIPDLIDRDATLETLLKQVHWLESLLLLAMVGLHVLAALKHHLVDRDEVLRRMLPFGGSR